MTKVLIIDDHPIVLEACKRALEGAEVHHIAQASSIVDGFRLYRATKPDVIIVDLSLRSGVLAGISFIRRLRIHDRRTPILVFSMHADPMVVARTFAVGATGYLGKATCSDEFVKAFRHVRAVLRYVSHDLASEIVFMEVNADTNLLGRLTLREWQTLSLLADGKSYGAIADELHVSYKTVANTASLVKTKLGAKNLPDLMRIAITHLPADSGWRNLAAR